MLLLVNIIAMALLRGGASESLNVKGAYLDVVADAAGSVGVIVAGLLVAFTGSPWWVATAHLLAEPRADSADVLQAAREVLADGHGIRHATFQVEYGVAGECEDPDW